MYFFSLTNITSRFYWIHDLGLIKRKECFVLYNKIINAQCNNECYKRNNKAQVTIKQRNNECTVTRILVVVREPNFCSNTRSFLTQNFCSKTKLFKFRNVRKPRFDCSPKYDGLTV